MSELSGFKILSQFLETKFEIADVADCFLIESILNYFYVVWVNYLFGCLLTSSHFSVLSNFRALENSQIVLEESVILVVVLRYEKAKGAVTGVRA